MRHYVWFVKLQLELHREIFRGSARNPNAVQLGYTALGTSYDSRDALCPWGMSRSHGDPFVPFFLPLDFISDLSFHQPAVHIYVSVATPTTLVWQPTSAVTPCLSTHWNTVVSHSHYHKLLSHQWWVQKHFKQRHASHSTRANSRWRRQCSDRRDSSLPGVGLHMLQFTATQLNFCSPRLRNVLEMVYSGSHIGSHLVVHCTIEFCLCN